jgi:hypothetical protein
MSFKKTLWVWGLCLWALNPAVAQELTERSRLGSVIEGATYISSGGLAGHVAIVDCWGVYVCDLIGGGYEKLFSVENISFGVWPRGIAHIGQGEFAGQFLFSDLSSRNKIFMVSGSGTLIAEVLAQDFQWNSCEGMTEITTGTYAGKVALVGFTNIPGGTIRHIYIFRMVRQDSGSIYAYLEKDIVQEHIPAPSAIRSLSIVFLPADFPDYPNHFLLGDIGGTIRVFDEQGILKATFPGIPNLEAMTYLAGGLHQGKLFIADLAGTGATVRTLDGSSSTPIDISVGATILGATSVSWLKDRQQLIAFAWSGLAWNYPMSVLSRPSPGQWRKEAEFPYTQLKTPLKMTDMTAAGTYYLFGTVDASPDKSPYRVHILDGNFQVLEKLEIPSEYKAESFGRLEYVPGATTAGDRFLLTQAKRVFSFDADFSHPAQIIDLSGKVNGLSRLTYDSSIGRYYALDDGGRTLRVFDRNWSQLAQYDVGGFVVRGFSDLTKFTSGDLRNNVGFLGGSERGDNEVVSINFEFRIGGDLLGRLSQDVLASGIKTGLANALSQKLENALRSVTRKNVIAAVNQVQAFQNEVRAQRGKDIPAAVADRWLDLSAEIIRGLGPL